MKTKVEFCQQCLNVIRRKHGPELANVYTYIVERYLNDQAEYNMDPANDWVPIQDYEILEKMGYVITTEIGKTRLRLIPLGVTTEIHNWFSSLPTATYTVCLGNHLS